MSSLEKERRTHKCFHAVVIFYMCFKTGLAPAQTSPVTAHVRSAHSLATALTWRKGLTACSNNPLPLFPLQSPSSSCQWHQLSLFLYYPCSSLSDVFLFPVSLGSQVSLHGVKRSLSLLKVRKALHGADTPQQSASSAAQ